MSSSTPIVSLNQVHKRFFGVQALSDVSLDLHPGEVVGLAGENGSGKSTLSKILAGRHRPDKGTISFDGRPVHWGQPAEALAAGVGLIAQEVLVHPDLSVSENLLFGKYARRFGVIDWATTHAQAESHLQSHGLHFSPRKRLGDLALHERHMVSILKMMLRKPRVLILDEPTSSLAEAEVDRLLAMIAAARTDGAAIVYITHRLREYFTLCDRLVVLRDGHLVAEHASADLSEGDLVRLMVGREMSSIFDRSLAARQRPSTLAAPAVQARGLSGRKIKGIDLDILAGEIVGLAGQAGSGRTSLIRTLFGLHPGSRGVIRVAGKEQLIRSPQNAIAQGFAYVPEDRKREGLVLGGSVRDNLILPALSKHARAGLRDKAHEAATATDLMGRMRIRAPSMETVSKGLSGGNQQKIVIGKWLTTKPRLLLLDEPTRGVDIGAKDEIYRLIEGLAAEGVGVLVASSELLELIRLCDRIIVLSQGRVAGEIDGDAATEEAITAMAFSAPHGDRHT